MEETLNTFHRVLSLAGIPIFAKTNWNAKSWLVLQIFNFTVGIFCFVFTTGFVLSSYNELLLFIQGACIWTTGIIMTISLGVCLIFRNDFRIFLNEMAFEDAIAKMPLVEYVLTLDDGRKLLELKNLVSDSQKKLLEYTRYLVKVYLAIVWLCVTLYLCTPIYQMIYSKDNSIMLLGEYFLKDFVR